jgi:predicted alpha-1,2-mannosidase
VGALAAMPSPASAADPAPVDLVNPFVGTQNFGNTFPGASAPFGMVQVSPDTGGQGGYDYLQNSMYGFSQTHLSGVGCGVAGELPIMPTTGAITSVDPNTYKSQFSHADEQATPGYYRVGLSRYQVNAELTATARTGWQRYTFPSTTSANVLFNTGRANQGVFDSEIHVVGDRTIEGRVHAGGFCAGKDDHTVFFSAVFDRPFAKFGTWRGSTQTADSRDAAGTGDNGAFVTFDATADKDVVLKVGLSYTGAEGARKNLTSETAGSFDFDATRAALKAAWVDQLGSIKIGGGTKERQTAFYTALYHAQLHPNLAGDVDGRYMGFDDAVHNAADFTPYQNLSLWDTYRPQHQLLQILEPQVARDVALSVVAIGRDGGWLPRWALANSETNIMTGDPVTPFLVEAWSKGLLAGHEAEAYDLLKKNATSLPPANSPYNGRAGVTYYDERGYVPSGLKRGTDCPDKGGDNDCDHPGSSTLEYSAADASLALMASGLGHTADAAMFAQRGQWYRDIWDPAIKHFHPRTKGGTFYSPYNPVDAGHQFHEGGSYQYQWLVPQDPSGLVKLLGGASATEQALDSFFAYDKLLANPAKTVREDWITQPFDYYGKSTYNPNNEPDLLAPYMYLWASAPAKTATVVRAAMTLFTTGPDGMTGNDDLGTMSAWYVFSSLGIYPTMNGANFLTLSSPQFESATIKVGAYGSKQGGTLTITAPGASDSARYIQKVQVNGSVQRKTWLDWSTVAKGGTIAHTVGTAPSDWGTLPGNQPPSVNKPPAEGRVHVDADLAAASAVVPSTPTAQNLKLPLDVLVQAPGSLPVTITATAPAGWTVRTNPQSPIPFQSGGLPAQKTIALNVKVPARVPVGTYPVTVVVSAEGGNTVTRKIPIEVQSPPGCASATNGQCAVDLTTVRNHDGTATVAANDQGNFDGGGWSFDADLLPKVGPVTWDGVTYDAPDPTGTALNFVQSTGQALLLPERKASTLRIVSSAYNGPVSTAVTVQYTDGTSAALPLSVADWCNDPEPGSTVILAMDHRIKAGTGTDGPPVKLFAHSLALDSSKAVRSVTLPNEPKVNLYAISLA